MKKMSEKIVFFGSGPVAAASLELTARDFNIEAVITKPKPSHHRGDFPVVSLAEKLDIKTFTPTNKKELSELFATKPVTSKIGLVIDYGLIISQEVIDYFPLGIVNSHFSLLPQWRGADPISFSILSGQPETGVSLMLIDAKMDEGPLLAQAGYKLLPNITTPDLTEELIKISHELLIKHLPEYVRGEIKPIPQDPDITPTYSRKLTKEDGIIDWDKPAARIEREIRAYHDWPKSRTQVAGKDIVITESEVVDDSIEAGKVKVEGKNLIIGTNNQSLMIKKLKPAGKKEMTAEAFLAGHRHLFN